MRLWVIILLSPIVGILDAIGLSLIVPFAIGVISGSGPEVNNTISSLIADLGFEFSSMTILYVIIFIFVAKLLLRYVHLALSAQISADFVQRLRMQLIRLIANLDYRHYTSLKAGHLLNTTTGEATKYATTQKAYVESISFLFILIGYAVLIVLNSWKSSLVLVAIGLSFSLIYRLLNSITKGLSRSIILQNREYNSRLIEMVGYFKYLKSTAQFHFFSKKLDETTNQSARIQFRTTLVNGIPTVIQEMVILIMITILWFVNHYFLQEPIEVVLIILAIGYRASGTLSQFQSRKQMFYSGIGSMEAVSHLVESLSLHQEQNHSMTQVSVNKNIRLSNVSVVLGSKKVLHDVSIDIPVNQTIALVGSSGSGKTTLIDVLAGILKPTSGTIEVDGVPLHDLLSNEWRKKIGYITQENMVFDGSLFENIVMDQKNNANQDALDNAVNWSRCREFADQLPEGLHTQVGERGIKLSGGQRQRIAIARELYKMPSLLIMDEATSALDTESEKIIQQSIDALKGKITTIIVAHRLSTIKNADMIYVLDQGNVVEQGPFDALTSNTSSVFFKMAELQELV